MKNNYKKIILIISISSCIGLIRNLLLDNPLKVIKKPRIISKVYSIPDLMLEPLSIDISFAKSLYDNKKAIFIDSRDKEDYDKGHILSSINIPYDNYEEYEDVILDLDIDFPLVKNSSGGDCELSVNLADLLYRDYEFTSVLIFESGYPDWNSKGYPIKWIKS